MKSLVLGGCGFIGSHVCEALSKKDEIRVYDIYHDPYLKFDFSNDLDESIKWADKIYNFAGILGTSSSFNYIPKIVETNIKFSTEVMIMCKHRNKILIDIGVPPAMWLNPYAITKACMTKFAEMFYVVEEMKGCTIIPYNVYGERQVFTVTQKLVPTVIHCILNNMSIPIFGKGNQIIDMMYAKDLAKCITQIDQFEGQTIHIGTGEEIKVIEIVKMICDKMNVEMNVEWLPTRKGEADEVKVVAPNEEWQKENLIFLSDGLDKSIEWYAKFAEYYKNVNTFDERVSILEPWKCESSI